VGNRSRAVLVGGGVFLIGVAALSRFYAYDTLAVAPSDQVTQVIAASGPEGAKVFDTKSLSEITTNLEAVRNVKAFPDLSEQASKDLDRDVVVYDMSIVTDKPGYVLPDDKTQTDRLPRSFSLQRMVLDARTGEAVSWKPQNPEDGEYLATSLEPDSRDYADEKGPGEGRPAFEGHKGLVLKFPFGTEKKTYDFWEANTRKAWPITYESEEKIEGLKTYKFLQEVPTTKISTIEGVPRSALKLPGEGSVDVDRDYKSTRTIWVEPVTGAIIKAADHQFSTLQYQGRQTAIATDATFTYTPDTVKKNVDGAPGPNGQTDGDYKSKAMQLNLVKTVVPLVALILGVLLLALAAFLQARPAPARARRFRQRPPDSPDEQA
jgi:Porin PorA